MIRINTSINSLIAQHNAVSVNNSLQKSLERLSSGLRINCAYDDPAGLIASENLNAEIVGTKQAIDNAQRASAAANVAEASLTEISDILVNLKQLIHESANSGAISEDERLANQQQIDSYIATIDRIGQSASFNGMKLLDGSRDYTLSGSVHTGTTNVTDAVNATFTSSFTIQNISFKNSYYKQNLNSYDLNVNFLVSGVQAHYTWSTTADFINTSNNGDRAALVISGYKGQATVDFSGGTNAAAIIAGINAVTNSTGVSAGLSGTNLVFSSTNFGADAFVSVTGIEPAEIVFTPDNYLLSGAGNGDAGLTITGRDGTHSYYSGYSTAVELNNLINADSGVTGVLSRLSGGDMVIYSADQDGSAFISVNKYATYFSNGGFANGSPAAVSWNTVNDYISVLADSSGSLNVKGVNGNINIALNSGTWTAASLASEINNYTSSSGVTAAAGAGSLTFTSTTGVGPNFVFVEATDSFSDSVEVQSFSAAGSGVAIGYNGANFDSSGSQWNEVTALTLSNYNGIAVDGSGQTQQFYGYTSVSSIASSTYTGSGGMEFSLNSTVEPEYDIILGLPEVSSTNLGNGSYGTIRDLSSGGDTAVASGKYIQAANVVDVAIDQIAGLRGRIGAFQKYTIDSTVRSQMTRLENLTSARSAILDTDFAVEIAQLTRMQILSQTNAFIMSAIKTQQQTVLQLLNNM